jgi:hypothetical protein
MMPYGTIWTVLCNEPVSVTPPKPFNISALQ